MPPIFRAELDLGTLIYMIAVLLWVIGNVLARSRKKKGRTTSTPMPGETQAEAELREFLEKLAGKPEEELEEERKMREAEPAPPARPEPPPPRARPVAAPRARMRQTAAPRPVTAPQPVLRTAAPPPAPEPDVTIDLERLTEQMKRDASSSSASFSTTLSSRGGQFKLPSMNLASLRFAMSMPRSTPVDPVLNLASLTNRGNLRRIIAGKIIIGPPRAFEPMHGEGEYRA